MTFNNEEDEGEGLVWFDRQQTRFAGLSLMMSELRALRRFADWSTADNGSSETLASLLHSMTCPVTDEIDSNAVQMAVDLILHEVERGVVCGQNEVVSLGLAWLSNLQILTSLALCMTKWQYRNLWSVAASILTEKGDSLALLNLYSKSMRSAFAGATSHTMTLQLPAWIDDKKTDRLPRVRVPPQTFAFERKTVPTAAFCQHNNLYYC